MFKNNLLDSLHQKVLLYLSALLFANFFVRCNNPNPNASKNSFADSAINEFNSSNLHILYLESGQLKKLLTDAKKKIVFQFLVQKNTLTLIAWSGDKHGNSSISTGYNHYELLHIAPAEIPHTNLNGKDIYFGNQEISKKNPDTRKRDLDTLEKLKDYSFIIFKPEIKPVDTFPFQTITYTVFGTNDSSQLQTFTLKFTTNISLNPSPPRGSY